MSLKSAPYYWIECDMCDDEYMDKQRGRTTDEEGASDE